MLFSFILLLKFYIIFIAVESASPLPIRKELIQCLCQVLSPLLFIHRKDTYVVFGIRKVKRR